ncbi:ferritin-like domain-containing protein [Zobellia amurskyensis]|uniref:Ferritin-like domain-containing protein n=1 Tax=Zobellia amurskyensis TaxID=248905 RepID=A0A7X2ZSJ1_9FLAO|nr:ferritin-like domain-containing protein [Zobellia amurskyensis]MUH35578.1 ferritin-like domain-containing protein [Zobellia amurskyensis]
MKTLNDLFEHQLKDLYSAEIQQLAAFPEIVEHASDVQLKRAFENHLKETREQKNRIENICRELNITPSGETCQAMKGLIKEAKHFIEEAEGDELMDVGLIAEIQRVQHYEISGYGTAVRFAKELGYRQIAKTLQETLNEEYDADNVLEKLAETRLNKKAINNA